MEQKARDGRRLRGRIEKILDWAALKDYRDAAPTLRAGGATQKCLSAEGEGEAGAPPPSLPYVRMGEFMNALRAREGIAARALEFTILTAARVSEAVGATWGEMDLDSATWTVPASRMKAHRLHRVALSKDAVRLLKSTCPPEARTAKAFVFPRWKDPPAPHDRRAAQGVARHGLEGPHGARLSIELPRSGQPSALTTPGRSSKRPSRI